MPRATPTAPKPVKPSLLAPKWEKALHKQISGTVDASRLHQLTAEAPEASATITLVEVLRVASPSGDEERLRALANWMFDIGYEPATDAFVQRYLPGEQLTVPIAPGITATMPVSRDALALLLVEIEQAAGSLARAIDVAESVTPTTIAAVSLAELYADAGRWDDVVDLTNGLSNDDDAAAFLLVQRGRAFRELGHFEAAREAFKEALRARSRPAPIRHLAYVERGATYLAEGKAGMARKDFERVLAVDAAYPGLRELLDSCGQ